MIKKGTKLHFMWAAFINVYITSITYLLPFYDLRHEYSLYSALETGTTD